MVNEGKWFVGEGPMEFDQTRHSRERIDLKSTPGATTRVKRAEGMPDDCYNEFRTAFEGTVISIDRSEKAHLDPVPTVSNRVTAILGSVLREHEAGVTYDLRVIAADVNRPGTSFALDPNEICLKHEASGTLLWGKWNRQFHFLEFEGLRFSQQYQVVFNSAAGGVRAEISLPPLPADAADEVGVADEAGVFSLR